MKITSPTWPDVPRSSLRSWQTAKLQRYLRDTVVPFSRHYRELFSRTGMSADDIRTPDDLKRIPFSSKLDFAARADGSDAVREFVLMPDKAVLARRPTRGARA